MFAFMTVRELQVELRKRNASVAGKKADLIQRLEAYDRNQNFGAQLDIQDDRAYACPPFDTYRDINADSPIPNIRKHEIQEYFQRFKAQPKGQLLYEARHLVTARYSSDGTFTYLRGQCKASMKSLTYVVDVKVTQEGSIEESHCECAAGNGTQASCKHVAVLLMGAHDIVNKGMILLHQVCTQRLMTFKTPKKAFQKSPIAAKSLPSKRLKTCNYKPLKEEDVMDNYEDYVRNLAIGYGETSMPLLQTYEPANPHAVEWDHGYAQESLQDRLLKKLLLKDITDEQIKEVELQTRSQDASLMWHEMRSCRITASVFYMVSHCTHIGKQAIIEKNISPKPVYTRAISHGKIHEPIAIEKYKAIYGFDVQKCGMFISKEHSFLAASSDGLLGEDTVIEVKCPYAAKYCLINEVTVSYLENVNGNLKLKKKHPYYAQIQGQLYCSERKYCNFIVYTFQDMKVLFIDRDDQYINEMLTRLINFYIHDLEHNIFNKYIYKDYLSLIKRQ